MNESIGEDAGFGFAEFAVNHRAGETCHIAFGEQGELDGANVAEAEEQGASFAHSGAE